MTNIERLRQAENQNDVLEAMIDHTSLADVVSALSAIAYDKEVHIRENWQDMKTADVWNTAARKLDNLAAMLKI